MEDSNWLIKDVETMLLKSLTLSNCQLNRLHLTTKPTLFGDMYLLFSISVRVMCSNGKGDTDSRVITYLYW